MLDRVQALLQQATPASRCLVTISMSLPFYLMYVGLNGWALADPGIRAAIRPNVLLGMQSLAICLSLAQAILAFWLWPRRQSPDPLPHLYTFLAISTSLLYCTESIIQGNLTSPANVVIVGSLALGLMLLDLQSVVLAYLLALIMFLVSDAMILQGVIPYAPMFTPAAFEQNMPQLWLDNIRDFILAIAIFFFCLFGTVLFNQIEFQRQTLRKLSYTDVLTGLANRRMFMDRLAAETKRAESLSRPFCLVMLDADHFKRVNDTYGHKAGDDVLRTIAAMLSSSVRCPTDVPARLGGEEFAILLPDTQLRGAQTVCDRIAGRLRDHGFTSDGHHFMVTISMGVVECRGETAETALKLADENLYKAKTAGRDRIVASLATPAGAI